jgi:hypothetical protein
MHLAMRLLDTSTITQLSRACRLVYDLYQHGRNREKGNQDPSCQLCKAPEDSLKHILISCTHSSQCSVRLQFHQQFISQRMHR